MRILLVHRDKEPWAATKRARALATIWDADICHADDIPDKKYDVIHFLYSGGITKSKKFILKNKDRIFTTLASYRTLEEYWDKKKDLAEIYRETRCCVCQNPDLLEKHRELTGQDNAVYIPNGVNTEIFNRQFIVGYVGARDSANHKGLPIIQRACDELGLMLKNAEGGENMVEFYRSIDCLVVASKSEGCNNPTLEALAMNVPVISTRTGIAEKLDGVFLIERNVESLIKALRKLSGRIQILEAYTWEKTAKQYMEMYVEK